MGFPKIDVCIVCEGVREEARNKHILLGFFGIAPYVVVQLKDFSLRATLCFVFSGGPGEGSFRVRLQLTSPSGVVLTGNNFPWEMPGSLSRDAKGTNVYMAFQGVVGPGRHRVSLFVDNVEHYATTIDLQPQRLVS